MKLNLFFSQCYYFIHPENNNIEKDGFGKIYQIYWHLLYLHEVLKCINMYCTEWTPSIRKTWPYSELFWSVFSSIWTRITPTTDTFHKMHLLKYDWLLSANDWWIQICFHNKGFSIHCILSLCLPMFCRHCTKKWKFLLRMSSVNVTKSPVSSGFGHICWRNL